MGHQLRYAPVHPETQTSLEPTLWLYSHGQIHPVGKLEYLLLKIHLLQHSLMGMLLIIYSIYSLLQHPRASIRKRTYPLLEKNLASCAAWQRRVLDSFISGCCYSNVELRSWKTAAVHLVSRICRLVFGPCNQWKCSQVSSENSQVWVGIPRH